ncbi:MAG: NYN domain-containing protein [Candidatus Woesearchaeota archaeon]
MLHKYIFEKVESLIKEQCHCLELSKTLIYTGEYNVKALTNVKKSCGSKIKEMNELITKENLLLEKVNSIKGYDELKKDVLEHVNSIRSVFESIRQSNIEAIAKQNKNAQAQSNFFEYVKNKLRFSEVRTTPLVTRGGRIQQKGVDAKFSTDLILLAQANAYDVGILLTGDADLKESIRLVRERYGKIIISVAYYEADESKRIWNTISEDLIKECDYFINLADFSENEIEKISVKKTHFPKHL